MVKTEELFCNFTPDAALVMTMLTLLVETLVHKNILTKQEVSNISDKLAQLVEEVTICLGWKEAP